ncbi:hypothetical protein OS493_017447, partial [Desmophyllum pertusum]
SDSDESVCVDTPAFAYHGKAKSINVNGRKKAQMYESWDVEEYSPGNPILPLGSYNYIAASDPSDSDSDLTVTTPGFCRNNPSAMVKDVSETGKCNPVKKTKKLPAKKKCRGKEGEGIDVIDIDLTCDSPEKRKRIKERQSSQSEDDVGSSKNLSEADEDEAFQDSVQKKQRKLNPDLWERAAVQEVSKLPCGMDGLAVYNISNVPAEKDMTSALLSDGRKWKKSTVTQWKRYGPMRYADCQGSFKCSNQKCPFRVQFGVVNRHR